MDTKKICIIAIIAVLVVAVAGAIVMTGGGDDSTNPGTDVEPSIPGGEETPEKPGTTDPTDPGKEDGKKTYESKVWLDTGSGEPTEFTGSGSTIKDIVNDALKGHNVTYRANGNIAAVDGKQNANDASWVVFRWVSPDGWTVFKDEASSYADGMSITVRFAEKTTDGKGNTTYSAPDIEVKYKVYFFIKFKEQLDSTEWIRSLPLSDSEKLAGVWISGYGSTSNEALADAVLRTFFPESEWSTEGATESGKKSIKYIVDGKDGMFSYGTSSEMYGWFTSFLGWSDTKRDNNGDYGTWTYWSQYTYHPDARSMDDSTNWKFNQFSFGLYDITKYRYFGLVLQTTTADDVDDKFVEMSTPSEIPEGV